MTETIAARRSNQAVEDNAIRPFRVNVPEGELTELRRRIKATRWPDRETVRDAAAKINPRIRLVAGGFHLVAAKDDEIDNIVSSLRDTYKVAYVAPGHCTGEPTFAALRKAFGAR